MKFIELLDEIYSKISKYLNFEYLKYKQNTNDLIFTEDILQDFPFRLILKRKRDKKEEINIFNGKLENLDNFNITKYNDYVDKIINMIIKYNFTLIVIFNKNSKYYNSESNYDQYSQTFESKLNEKISLYDCLDLFTKEETLNNLYDCKNCGKINNINKKISLYYTQKILIVNFKRFLFDSNKYLKKNNKYISYPINNLDLNKYIIGPDKNNTNYELICVSEHYGSMENGHYTASCKNIDENWYHYNDTKCELINNYVCSKDAYVLFYRRKKW